MDGALVTSDASEPKRASAIAPRPRTIDAIAAATLTSTSVGTINHERPVSDATVMTR